MRSEIRRWWNAHWWPAHIKQLDRERADWKRWCEDAESKSFAAVVGDEVLYYVKEISTQDAFVNGGMLAIDAVHGTHRGALVQVYPEKRADDE